MISLGRNWNFVFGNLYRIWSW